VNADASIIQVPTADNLWKQYALHLDVYKAHLDIVVKVLTFYYAITGGIVSYYLTHPTGGADVRFALVLPLVFSIGLGVIAFRGARLIFVVQQELGAIARRLGLQVYPALTALVNLLRLAAAACAITALGLTYLLLK